MAISLNHYRFSLLEIVNQTGSDSDIDLRLLDQFIIDKREKFFQFLFNKWNKTVPQIYYQTLPCVEVIDVDQSECCEIATGCTIKRTKDKLPQFISLSDGDFIDKVGPTFIVTVPFNIIPYRRAEYFGTGKYDKKSIGVFLYNGYLYLISNDTIHFPLLEFINIRGIFRDPMEAARFKTCDGKPCFSADDAYPLDGYCWDLMKAEILKVELATKLSMPRDNIADNQNNITDATA